MNTKPDEATLLSYLYDELSEQENQEIQHYFELHPEELKRLQEMKEVLHAMSRVKDKEVIAPSLVTPINARSGSVMLSLWNSGIVRTVMSIAASFLLIMVAGKFLGTEISLSGGELRISFTARKVERSTPTVNRASLSPADVQGMINSSLNRNNEVIQSTWAEHQKKMENSLRVNLEQSSGRIDDLMKSASESSQDQVQTFVAGLQSDNLRLMKDYLQLSSTEQKKYVESLLVDFSKYMQEQRNQDLSVFQTRMSSMEKNTDQFKLETEQILTSIISNRANKKQNSY